MDRVKARIEASSGNDELAALLGAQLATETRVLTDVKALPASGLVQASPAATGDCSRRVMNAAWRSGPNG